MKNPNNSYKLYSYRWVVITVYALAVAMIQIMWATFFSITTEAGTFYGFTDAASGAEAMSLLSVIVMVGTIVLSVPSMALFEKIGFKWSVSFGVIIVAIAGLVRGFVGASYITVVICTIGFAIGQPFILNSIGMVAGKWFPVNERATANSIGMLANYIGIAIALILSPVILSTGVGISGVLKFYGIFSAVIAVLFVVLAKEQPPTPPCSEEDSKRENFVQGLKIAIRKKNFILVLIYYLFAFGIFTLFFTMIDPVLNTLSNGQVDPTHTGLIGVIILVAGVVGSPVFGAISDRDPQHRRLRYAIVGIIIATFGFAIFLIAKSYMVMVIASLIYGALGMGATPLLMTFAAEETYPVSEGTSEGMMMFFGNIGGALLTLSVGLFNGNYRLLMLVCVIMTFLSWIPLILATIGKRKR